jgi:putative MFS transporter
VAQTIEGFVGTSLDTAKISPLHIKVIALIAAGYFFDVIDLIVLGSLIPDMVQSKFATGAQAAWIGSATVLGMFIGAAGQGQFSDRWGRKSVYQFNLLLFGIFTILGALAPTVWWLVAARFIAGLGLGGEQPLAFPMPANIRPRRSAAASSPSSISSAALAYGQSPRCSRSTSATRSDGAAYGS